MMDYRKTVLSQVDGVLSLLSRKSIAEYKYYYSEHMNDVLMIGWFVQVDPTELCGAGRKCERW